MASRQVTGIYIAVRGDYTQYKEDLKKVRAETKAAATDISNAFGHAVMPGKVERSMKSFVANLHTASSTAATASVDFNKLKIALSEIGQVAGISEKEFYALQNRLLQTAASTNVESSFKNIQKAIGATDKEMLAMREDFGASALAVSAAFKQLNVTPLQQVKKQIQDTIAAYRLLANSELTSSQEVRAAKAAELAQLKKIGQEYRNLRSTSEAATASSTGTSTSAYSTLGITSTKKLRKEYAKLSAAYTAIKADATSTKADVVNAQLAMESKAKQLSQAYNALSKAAKSAAIAQREEAQAAKSNSISNAYSTLGVTSQQSLIKEMREASNAYTVLRNSGVASARDISEAHTALKAVLNKNLTLLRGTFSFTPSSNLEQAVERIREKYVVTDEQLAALQAREAKTAEANSLNAAFREIAVSAGLTDEEVTKLRKDIGALSASKTEASIGGFTVRKLAVLSSRFLSLAASIGLITYSLLRMEKGLYAAQVEADAMKTAFTNIEGSATRANAQMEFLRKTATATGQNFWTLADSYKGLLAASKYSNISLATTQQLFTGLMKAASDYSLSTEQVNGAVLAFTQIISKGKVAAEELRRQLGDRLYGSFGLAAKAMGLTTQQLDKLMSSGKLFATDFIQKIADVLNDNFTGNLPVAVERVNKLSQAWEDFKVNVGDSSSMENILSSVTDLLNNKGIQSGTSATLSAVSKVLDAGVQHINAYAVALDKLMNSISIMKSALSSGLGILSAWDSAWAYYTANGKQATEMLKDFATNYNQISTGNLVGFGKNFATDITEGLGKAATIPQSAIDSANKWLQKVSSSGDAVSDRIAKVKNQVDLLSSTLANIGQGNNSSFAALSPTIKNMQVLEARIKSIKAAWSSMSDKSGEEQALAPLVAQLKSIQSQRSAISTLKQLQTILAYTESHAGYTPAQTTKINASIQSTIAENKNLLASYASIGSTTQKQASIQLKYQNALSAARKKYNKEISSGADESLAKEELLQNQQLAEYALMKQQVQQAQEFKKAYNDALGTVDDKVKALEESLNKYSGNKLVDSSQLSALKKQLTMQLEVNDAIKKEQTVADYDKLTGDSQGYLESLKEQAALQVKLAKTTEERQLAEEKYTIASDRAADNWAAGWEQGIKDVKTEMGNDFDNMRSLASNVVDTLTSDFASFLADLTTDWDDATDDMSDTMLDMLNDVAAALYQVLLKEVAAGLISGIGGSSSSVTELGASDLGSSTSTTIEAAKGGVFSGGSITSMSGGIATHTTPFTYNHQVTGFAKGGVVGEGKQDEAILPIYKGANGVYGVKASTDNSSSSNQSESQVNQTFNLTAGVSESVRRALEQQMPYIKQKTLQALEERQKRGYRI